MNQQRRTIQPITVYSRSNAIQIRNNSRANVPSAPNVYQTQYGSGNQNYVHPYMGSEVSTHKQMQQTRIKTSMTESQYTNYNRRNQKSLQKSIIYELDRFQPQQKKFNNPYPYNPNNQSNFGSFSNISAIQPRAESTGNPTYSQLLQQNKRLKRIIKQQYEPLKEAFSNLKQQHDERDYLVSKLEWKVKQLAKDLHSKNK